MTDAGNDHLTLYLFVLFAMLLVLDVVTTTRILLLGGVELNPLMRGVVSSVPLHTGVKAIFFAVMVLWAQWWDVRIRNAGIMVLTVLCTWFTFVVVHNISSLVPHLPG
ncbi:MAG: hypothetical protein GX965_04535 [Methanoculleus bourgensis]|jgi:hypothetical protein|uniref:DUF5658 family protein n=1 Tax=Methanoculleus bourgensis TaxID=83986 RepID=UPI0017BD6805|nr:DUF5658 family protein [Methanoculleus bourgensis]NMA88421.1 hypothetical protein [Methanoculleus bourgensis]GLI45989.1 hypothetical protein MBOURGENBZM_07810 [Methanoculleus bourgensis]